MTRSCSIARSFLVLQNVKNVNGENEFGVTGRFFTSCFRDFVSRLNGLVFPMPR